MDLDKILVCDIETKGYLKDLNSFEDFHVLGCSYRNGDSWGIKTTNKREDIKKVIGNPENTVVFHNGVSYDKPALIKMGFDFKANIVDTLGLSYYLYSERDKHGLAHWGEFFGVKKPDIEDWEGLSYEEYQSRVTEDVKINTNLWVMMLGYMRKIYDNDQDIIRVIEYINHKMYMLHLQEMNPLKIDLGLCKKNLDYLQEIIDEKTYELSKIMPKVAETGKKSPPSKPYKKDGSMSALQIKWLDFLGGQGLPETHKEEVEYVKSYKDPNPQSTSQIKDFLFSLGWKPKLFKDGANGKVPQLRDDDKELCESIKKLIPEHPELKALDGLSVAQHRAGYLKSFLDKTDENGMVSAWAHAFTRTLRLCHVAPLVNMPKPNAEHGNLVRSVITAPEGYVCIGADLSSIEDKCKQISIHPYDPKYVESMNTVGWDAHLALGLMAGMFTQDEAEFYKWYKNRDKDTSVFSCPESFKGLSEDEMSSAYESLDKKRATAKTGTYSLTYGAGAPKVSESADITLKEAKKLHKGYWDMNWSVKKFSKDREVKTVKGTNWVRLNKKAGGLQRTNSTKWIWNEYSKMFLYLKNDKDRFSACNQNFGVKVFDVWGYILINNGIKPQYQSHDEYLWYCKKEDVNKHIEILGKSVVTLNKMFKPPVPIEIDYKVGENYAEVH